MSTPIGRAITNVWYFAGCESTFLVEVAQSMMPRFFNKQEVCDEVIGMLGICQRGAVARNGRIFLPPRFWGEDMILHCDDLREMYPVISLTYSEVLTLARQQLDAIVRAGLAESSRKRLSRAAMIIAITKTTQLVGADRERDTLTHPRFHHLLDEGKIVGRAVDAAARHAGSAVGGFYMFSNHDAKAMLAKQRADAEGVVYEAAGEPFHKQVVKELRLLQRCCAQDVQALARRAAASSAAAGTCGDMESAHAGRLEEPNAPLDLDSLCLELPGESRGEDNEPASPEALAQLSAQVESISRQLSRLGLGVLSESHLPELPPEPPPSQMEPEFEREDTASLMPSPSRAGSASPCLASRALSRECSVNEPTNSSALTSESV